MEPVPNRAGDPGRRATLDITHIMGPKGGTLGADPQPAEPKNAGGGIITQIHDISGGVNHIFTGTAREGVEQGVGSLHAGTEHIDADKRPTANIGHLVQYAQDSYGKHRELHNVVSVFRKNGQVMASHHGQDFGAETSITKPQLGR